MKKLLLLLLVCYASPAAAQMCQSSAGNSPGDIVQTWTDFWDQGVNAFSWEVYINGTSWRDYGGVTDLTASGGCLHQCKPLRFVARTSNVSISNGVTGGNASGWRCTQVVQIIGHDEGPIKAEKKARAQRNADIFDGLTLAFGAVIPVSCAILFEPYSCTAANTGAGASAIAAWGFKRIVQRDPWRDDYLSVDGPPMRSAEELALSYTDDYYQNQMIGDIQGAVLTVDFMLIEVDRYSSCQMANVDCLAYGVNHQAYIDWALWMLGWYMNDLGNNAWTVGWIMEQNGATAESVQAMRDLAQSGNDAGWEFQQ